MNEIIALPQFAERIAELASIDNAAAEKFVRTFFAQVENALTVSESITIKGLGTFFRTNENEKPLDFKPDEQLARDLNLPFSIFDPVELEDGMDTDDISDETSASDNVADTNDAVDSDNNQTPETIQSEPEQAESETLPTENVSETQCTDETKNVSDDTANDDKPDAKTTTDNAIDTDEDLPETPVREHKKSHGLIFLLIGLIIGMVIGYFYHDLIKPSEPEHDNTLPENPAIENATVQDVDIVQEVDTVTTDTITPMDEEDIVRHTEEDVKSEPVYDTVTPERFLTTMARKYYGHMEYWVFIYQANSDILGNPNRIKPGTRVRIPDESEFTDGETPEQTMARAKEIGVDIYARF